MRRWNWLLMTTALFLLSLVYFSTRTSDQPAAVAASGSGSNRSGAREIAVG